MGWHASYQILSDAPLSSSERLELAELAIECGDNHDWDGMPFSLEIADEGDGKVVARGSTQLAMDEESLDSENVLVCLEMISENFPQVRVLALDDFGAVGSDRLVEVSSTATFRPAHSFLEAPAAEPGDVASLLRSFAQTKACGDAAAAAIAAELDEQGGDEVVAAALAEYKKLDEVFYGYSNPFKRAVARADPQNHVNAFLDLWRQRGGTYWHHDMLQFLEPLLRSIATVPEVERQMCDDLAAVELNESSQRVARRAGSAARILGFASSDTSLAALLKLLVRARTAKVSREFDYHVHEAVIVSLGERKDQRAFATLALAIAAADRDPWRARKAAASCAPERAIKSGTESEAEELAVLETLGG